MKKSILYVLAICLIFVGLQANEIEFKYAKRYFSDGGKLTDELKELLKKDKFFLEGNDFLENPKNMKVVLKDTATDPHSEKKEIKEVAIPQFDKALDSFTQSVKTYQNPLSAFVGIYIINTKFGRNNFLDQYNLFSKVLYEKEKNICDSYLNYGAIFEKGYLVEKDFKKAFEIYSEGVSGPCSEGWQKSVVESKLFLLEKWLKKDEK